MRLFAGRKAAKKRGVGGLIGLCVTAEKRRSADTLMQNLRMMLHRTLAK
jgi:hypothetical protein